MAIEPLDPDVSEGYRPIVMIEKLNEVIEAVNLIAKYIAHQQENEINAAE